MFPAEWVCASPEQALLRCGKSFDPFKSRGPVKLPRGSRLHVWGWRPFPGRLLAAGRAGRTPLLHTGRAASAGVPERGEMPCAALRPSGVRCCSGSETCTQKRARTGAILTLPVWFCSAGLCGFGFLNLPKPGSECLCLLFLLSSLGSAAPVWEGDGAAKPVWHAGFARRTQGRGCRSFETAAGCQSP